jgi:hypothetical protein
MEKSIVPAPSANAAPAAPAAAPQPDAGSDNPTPAVPAASAAADVVTGVERKPIAPGSPTLEGNGGKKDTVVDEIKHVRKRAQTAEAEAAYWRGVAEARAAKTEPAPSTTTHPTTENGPPTAPSIAQFSTYEEYERAKDEYLVKKAKWEVKQETIQQEQGRQAQALDQNWAQKMDTARLKYDDFDDVVRNPMFVQSDPVTFLVKDSEVGADLAYYLGTHLKETAKINNLPPHLAAKEIWKIEMKLTAPKPAESKKVISMAPDPIKPVVPVAPAEVADEDLSMEDFVKKRNSKDPRIPRRRT